MDTVATFGVVDDDPSGIAYCSEIAPALVVGDRFEIARDLLLNELESVRHPGIPLTENHALGAKPAHACPKCYKPFLVATRGQYNCAECQAEAKD